MATGSGLFGALNSLFSHQRDASKLRSSNPGGIDRRTKGPVINIAAVGLLAALVACTTTDTAEEASDVAPPAIQPSASATAGRSSAEDSTDWRYAYLIFMVGETRINRNRFVAVAPNGDRVPLPPDVFTVFNDNPDGIEYIFGSDTRFREVCIGTRHCAVFSRFRAPGVRRAFRGIFPEDFQND